MKLKEVKKLEIPKVAGSYQYFDGEGKIIYVGKAIDLRSRVFSYFRASANHTLAKKLMVGKIEKIEWIETETEIEALLLEANLIKKFQPFYNIDKRDDKRFSYIKISTDDEIPGVFVTRKIDKSGKYFGPFTSALAVHEVLKAIRKIWPYCTERKIKDKPCFYAQIGRCTGVCGGKQALLEYKKQVIESIVLFLSGKKRSIIKNYELRIRDLEKKIKNNNDDTSPSRCATYPLPEGDLRELDYLRFQLGNMKNVLAHTRILSVADKYEADTIELAKVLNLSKVPERIEGYDISNIFGKEAVGSMVVFAGGEPDSREYRKFKIKIGQGEASDTGMLREVLERRFNRITNCEKRIANNEEGIMKDGHRGGERESWARPDLIIIDGGKGQLNVAVRLLRKYDLDISVISISKGKGLRSSQAPDKIFFPGEAKALELPLSSPALHIIKRVRDEAHRFAIRYHRELRRKSWMK